MNFLIVALGGALGALTRYSIGIFFKFPHFPFHTMLINISGSFLIGMVTQILINKYDNIYNNWHHFIIVGILGGFTTFSAFSLEAINMLIEKNFTNFILYISGSVIFSLLAVYIGMQIVRA